MSRRELSNDYFLKMIIKTYYSRKPIEEPIYFHKREIALESLEDRVYIRHLCFPSISKLYEYILSNKTPLHLYYSSAYYEDPCADQVELKGWIGSDLMFDIDSDKYPECSEVISICLSTNTFNAGKIDKCSGDEEPIYYSVLKNKCIDRAFQDVVKLYDILRIEFGLKDIEIYFTGNRGFHVKVNDSKILDLDRDARREIVSYIKLENVDLHRLFFVKKTRQKYVLLFRREHGIRRRILDIVLKSGIKYEVKGDYIKIPRDQLEVVLEEARVNIDPVVTIDTSRLSRFKYSLNCKTGLVVKPIDINKYNGFNLDDFNPWVGGIIVKPLVDVKIPVFDQSIVLKRGEAIYIDSFLAINLALKNLVRIIDLKDFGVRNVRSIS